MKNKQKKPPHLFFTKKAITIIHIADQREFSPICNPGEGSSYVPQPFMKKIK